MVEYILQQILTSGKIEEHNFKNRKLPKKFYFGKRESSLSPDIKISRLIIREKEKKDKIIAVKYQEPIFVRILLNMPFFHGQYIHIKKNEIGLVIEPNKKQYDLTLKIRLKPFELKERTLERLFGINYIKDNYELPLELLVKKELSKKEREYVNKYFQEDF